MEVIRYYLPPLLLVLLSLAPSHLADPIPKPQGTDFLDEVILH